MNFIENIYRRLAKSSDKTVLEEVRDDSVVRVQGSVLAGWVKNARAFIRREGLKKGDRCALLANNSLMWAAVDLALMGEGVIVVPLYARQAPAELAGMMRDCSPRLLICGDETLADSIKDVWKDHPPIRLINEAVRSPEEDDDLDIGDSPVALSGDDPVTIIYTSGTSGEPKGVILNVGNINFMLPCTNARLDLLMGQQDKPDKVFHYLPFCFAGSWILLLTALSRNAVLTMSTDLNKLADEMKLATPNYFLNVPVLLERVRSGIEDQINKKGGIAKTLYDRGKAGWFRRLNGESAGMDGLWLALAGALVFPKIKEKLGPNLKAMICGSAPLAKETQLFFNMIGIPVLQVYGLTETTAICTMDHPHKVTPGRVGPAITGIKMKLGEGDEILVQGPNIFPGYWNRPEATSKSIVDRWFHTGDQGEVDDQGNWSIIGRVKNIIVLSSGHNIAPEPIEEMMMKELSGAQQVLLVGHGRGYVSAIVTGDVTSKQVEAALETVNTQLPHYKRVRAFHIEKEPFTIENGLLTANGKYKRDTIVAHFKSHIEGLYQSRSA
ncbi:MAG TPA: AMP-binding protein [Blastocatellia bacterium]|nr:AMP-binding protein [Blastocatellia bacterium]